MMMKTLTLTRQVIAVAFLFFFFSLPFTAQTLIDFDDDSKWIRSSEKTISGYCTEHRYEDGVFTATGGEASRVTDSEQDGFPGALGDYAWKLRDRMDVNWRITIASGGVGTFSIDIRRWDDDPEPNYLLDYSTDGGNQWEEVAVINNSALNYLSDWKTFSGIINSSNNDIVIRLTSTQGTERIMVDNFEWTSFTVSSIAPTPEGIIEIWPNPASHTIWGKVENPLTRVELVNMAGRKVKGKILSGEKEFSISVNEMKNGIYFVRMMDVSGNETCARVVVLH